MTDTFTTPEWTHHAIFYQIFPDRFATSPAVKKPNNLEPWNARPTSSGFKGGDLLGIRDHLDYLQDLGITAIYFNPIFQSASNHRYHTHDFYQVDPLLGGNAAFRTLLDNAHRRGIRVVLDGVFNHASRGFFQFNHILECGRQSPYLDWFKVKQFPMNAYEGKPGYDCWWNIPALPTLNHSNPQVRDYIMDIARFWVDFGIDGWRLDVPFEIKDPTFWQEFRHVVKSANPDAYITGEIPWDATPWLQGDQFDGVMNYLMTYPSWSFFPGEDLNNDLVGHWRDHGPDLFVKKSGEFLSIVTQLLTKYPRPAVLAQLNLIDSHDTARFLSLASGNKAALRLATVFQMTYPGAPCIYYGNEIGLEGEKDPDCRRAFPWDENLWDKDLLGFFKHIVNLRKNHPSLRDGEWYPLSSNSNDVVVYARTSGQDRSVIILNRGSQTYHLDVSVDGIFANGTIFKNELQVGTAQVTTTHLSGISIAPQSAAVLVG
jgi:cyclomaltodextrinase / maltogenic alpha-amylase / neopullulanase